MVSPIGSFARRVCPLFTGNRRRMGLQGSTRVVAAGAGIRRVSLKWNGSIGRDCRRVSQGMRLLLQVSGRRCNPDSKGHVGQQKPPGSSVKLARASPTRFRCLASGAELSATRDAFELQHWAHQGGIGERQYLLRNTGAQGQQEINFSSAWEASLRGVRGVMRLLHGILLSFCGINFGTLVQPNLLLQALLIP